MFYTRLTSVRSLARVLESNITLAKECGFRDKAPGYRTLARRFTVINPILLALAQKIAAELIESGAVDTFICAIDSTTFCAKGAEPKNKRHKGDRVVHTDTKDPDATYTYSPSKGYVLGYKLHSTCTTGRRIIPLSWDTTPAHISDDTACLGLMERVPYVSYWVADKKYDSEACYFFAKEHGSLLTTPVRRYKNNNSLRQSRIDWYESPLGQYLFKKRASAERLFSAVKRAFRLDPLPMMGMNRVWAYVNIAIVAYLVGIYYNWKHGRPFMAIQSILT